MNWRGSWRCEGCREQLMVNSVCGWISLQQFCLASIAWQKDFQLTSSGAIWLDTLSMKWALLKCVIGTKITTSCSPILPFGCGAWNSGNPIFPEISSKFRMMDPQTQWLNGSTKLLQMKEDPFLTPVGYAAQYNWRETKDKHCMMWMPLYVQYWPLQNLLQETSKSE